MQNIVSYYKSCYQADSRELSLWNIGKLKATDVRYFSEQEELASREFPRAAIDPEFAETMLVQCATYRREKMLIYGVLFVCGKLTGSGLTKARTVAAPLLYYSADIEQEGRYSYISIEDKPSINIPLLRSILTDNADDTTLSSVPNIEGPLDLHQIASITRWLTKNTLISEPSELLLFPKLESEAALVSAGRSKGKLHIVRASALALVERPKNARGILHELEQMTQGQHDHAALKALFFQPPALAPKPNNSKWHSSPELLPVLLSKAQQQALSIAASETLGLVSGPPGTGKSFTIAAMVADRLLNGENVLVVSETEQAVEVIATKLAEHFSIEQGTVRAGRAEYLSELKKYLDHLLVSGGSSVTRATLKQQHQALLKCRKEIAVCESRFNKRSRQSIAWGEILSTQHRSVNWFSRLQVRWVKRRIRNSSRHWHLIKQIEHLETQKEALSRCYIKDKKAYQLQRLLAENRQQLVQFSKAIRARTSLRQQSLFDEMNYPLLLQAFPVWLVSLNTLHKVLPLSSKMFDLVIVDEASQCNIAASIPALYRAKRVVVVGDAKQLRHISFLSQEKERSLMQSHLLPAEQWLSYSYRNNSLLDKVSDAIVSQSALTMLDEHFRSRPELIHFSNQYFYHNQLKVMQHRPGASRTDALVLHYADNARDKEGRNDDEARRLLALLTKLCAEQAELESRIKPPLSIGILSPYRAQADLLEKMLIEQFTHGEIHRHQIKVGTPYQFQGEERDIMLLSFALCRNSRQASNYLNREDVFNVAITRAKQQQHLFVSLEANDLAVNNMLRHYLESSVLATQARLPTHEFDHFQDELCEALTKIGITCWKGYLVAGQTMDIVCGCNDAFVAIDLIGFSGQWQGFFELSAYKLLSRAGLAVIPLSYGIWLESPELCLSHIGAMLAINDVAAH